MVPKEVGKIYPLPGYPGGKAAGGLVDGKGCAFVDRDVEVLVAVAEGALLLTFNFLIGDPRPQTSTELFAAHLLLVRLDLVLVLDLVLNVLFLGEFSGILEALELFL
jgi:hypothetical protein